VAVSKGVERSFAQSAYLYSRDLSKFNRRTYTIHNGINVRAFRSEVDEVDREAVRTEWGVDGDVVYLNIGRYSAEKNQSLLLRTMADVLGDADAHLFIVGWGDLEDNLRQMAADLDIADNVTITGRVPTVHEYYAMADVFVLPSVTEGLSVVLLEAMSAGLPIVATDVAGTGEAIVDGTTGYVVSPGSQTELADAMYRLRDTGLRRRLGKHGYERACEEFSIHETARSYVDIYRRVVSP
jgi:glycosyltransferase involved in cell wall biosynthesis